VRRFNQEDEVKWLQHHPIAEFAFLMIQFAALKLESKNSLLINNEALCFPKGNYFLTSYKKKS
jgi:hypothetical protein